MPRNQNFRWTYVLVFIGFLFAQCQAKEPIFEPVNIVYTDTLEAAKFSEIPYLENESTAYFMGLDKWNDRKRVIDYFKDGTAKAVYETKNDTLIGPWREWHFSGRLNGSGFYNEKGGKYGPWKLYYDAEYQGKDMLASIEHYKDDALHGLLEKWYPNGTKELTYHYVEGNKEGLCTVWYDNGKLKQEMLFKNNILQQNKLYYEEGQLAQVIPYNQAGKMEGEAVEYDKTGKIKRQVTFVNGKEISK